MSNKKHIAWLMSLILATSLISPVFAETDDPFEPLGAEQELMILPAYTPQTSYGLYYDKLINGNASRPQKELFANYKSASSDADVAVGGYEDKSGVVIWKNQSGTLDFTVDVPESGAYNIEICYFPVVGGNVVTETALLIDGEVPFDTAERIWLPRVWSSEYPIYTDSRDNEIRPPQVETPQWVTTTLFDVDGLFNEPLLFYFEQGERTVSLKSEKASIAIAYVKLYNKPQTAEYVKPSLDELSNIDVYAETIKKQGESFLYTNASTIIPLEGRGNYLTEPSHPVKIRCNSLAAGEKAGESATWNIDVLYDGYYKIGIKARQNSLRGMYANRRLFVDGETPNERLSQIKFYYNSKWQTVVPKDEDGDPVYVYLTQGRHELSLETIPGEIGESMRRLQDIVVEANALYMKMLMLTGPKPDKYTDYRVDIEIPELIPEFDRLAKALIEEQAYIESLSSQGGSEAAVLNRLADVLQKCVTKKTRIPDMIRNESIKNSIAAVSAWMRQYRYQPIEIDFIEIAPFNAEFTSVKQNPFKKMSYDWKAFWGSFTEDYTVMSDVTQESINVWVSGSRFHANIIKRLTEQEFMRDNDSVAVSINLVQGSIMEAVLAGKGPDAAIYIGGEFPVNLAVRDLSIPLNDMDGFNEVTQRFQKNALTHYTYDNKVYGLPISQTFPMMFYRKDMLASVGIANPPETWDDLIDMLPALQRSHMQPGLVLPGVPQPTVGAGVSAISISPATETGHTFALLMLQTGEGYYNAEQTRTNFDSPKATQAFTTWTDFYNLYKFDQTYDPFTRFRTGECPIVIKDYASFYNQLTVAAPEITGLWDFTSVPGTRREDGTVSHAANSNGTGYVILKNCKNVDAAWEYGKWFTTDDIMTKLGREIEGVLGPLGRFESANVNALKNLNWAKTDLDKILAQMDELEEIPIIPASYTVTRNVINSFRTVVNDKWNPRETLRFYNIDMNDEIARKRENLGLVNSE